VTRNQLLFFMVLCVSITYMLIDPHVGTSYKFYAQQVQVLRDGYHITVYPITPWLLYCIDIFVNNITLSIKYLTMFCMALSTLLCLPLTRGKHTWLALLIPMNPYFFFMAQNALVRNVVSVPLLIFLLFGLDQINRKQIQQGMIITGTGIFLLFFTHNLSLMVGSLMVVMYTLLSDNITRQKKSLIIFIISIIAGMVLLSNMEALVPWMLANAWVNWPRIFESILYVPVVTVLFNFILVILFPPDNTVTRMCAIVGALLIAGSWIAPIGIDMRLIYYTPLFLLPCIHSNIVERRYVGVQLFSYVLLVTHFLLLVCRWVF